MTHLYNCRSFHSDFAITKFDLDLNVLASYHTSHEECDCPRGNKPDCRHRKMLKLFIAGGHIDDGWFLDYETRLWTMPLGTALATSPATNQPEPVPASPAVNGSGATTPPAPEGRLASPASSSGALRIRRIPNQG